MRVNKLVSLSDKLNLIRTLKDVFDNEAEYSSQDEYQEDDNETRIWVRNYPVSDNVVYYVSLYIEDSQTSSTLYLGTRSSYYFKEKSGETNYTILDSTEFTFENVNEIKEHLGIDSLDMISALLGKNLM